MTLRYDSRLLPIGLIGVIGICIGVATAQGIVAGLIVGGLGLAMCAITVAPAYWALGAIIAAVALPVLPGFGSYLHFPLAFAGFALAGLRYKGGSSLANFLLTILGLLALSCVMSTAIAGVEPTRGLFSFVVLGEPIALLATIACVPPTQEQWRNVRTALLILVLIQLPIAYLQVLMVGVTSLFHSHLADRVKGTVDITGGQDVLAAIAAVGGVWLLALPRQRGRIFGAVALLLLPFLAGANKVILSIPAVIMAAPRAAGIKTWVRVSIAAVPLIVLVFFANLLPGYILPSLRDSLSTEGGKGEALTRTWSEIDKSPASLAFGVGPAETVSGTAYLTAEQLKNSNSPIGKLHMKPSETAIDLGALEKSSSSFNRPRSSTIGTLGDLGFFGLLVYLFFLGAIYLRIFSLRSPEAVAGGAGMILIAVYGVISTGWELPSLTLFVMGIVGLALTEIPAAARRIPEES